jgi:threonine dehydrogenase-like Zn-dependent dehydrogenase
VRVECPVVADRTRASVLVAKETIKTAEFTLPVISEDATLLRTAMCGVCGTDVHLYLGHTPPGTSIPYPFIPGHEIVGTIDEMGKSANSSMKIAGGKLEEGDRALLFGAVMCDNCWGCRHLGNVNGLDCVELFGYGFVESEKPPHLFGGYSEYLYVVPKSWLWEIPDDMPWEIAVLSDPLSTGVRCIEKALTIGSISNNVILPFSGSVVIQGSGAMGVLAAAAAKVAGAKNVIMTGAPAHRLTIAQQMGVDTTINILETEVEERVKQVRSLTSGGKGADVVIELAGTPEALLEGLEMIRKGGTYVEAGNFLDVGRTINVNVCKQLCAKDLTFHSVYGPSPRHFEKAFEMLASTKDRFPYEKLVTHRFKIEEASQAMRSARSEECLKAVITGPGL